MELRQGAIPRGDRKTFLIINKIVSSKSEQQNIKQRKDEKTFSQDPKAVDFLLHVLNCPSIQVQKCSL